MNLGHLPEPEPSDSYTLTKPEHKHCTKDEDKMKKWP